MQKILNTEQVIFICLVATPVNRLRTTYQRWSRGHKARGQGQGHKKILRPRPRTDHLEAKDTGASVLQKKKVFKNFFQAISKKKVLKKFFSGEEGFQKKFFYAIST